MKYVVKTQIVSTEEREIEVSLPLGVKDDSLTDQMVRAQAKEAPEALVELAPDEVIVEVWRDKVRIFPRRGRGPKVRKDEPQSPEAWLGKDASKDEG